MELRQLRYFIAVAERLSFREAAEAMCISQPPLTRQVQQLEQELQCALLKRSTRSVVLTADGERYLKLFREIVDELDETADKIARIGVNKARTWRLWAPWFADFAKSADIDHAIATHSNLVAAQVQPKPPVSVSRSLMLGKVDCIIVDAVSRNAKLKSTPLGLVPYGVATAATVHAERRDMALLNWIVELGPLLAVATTTDTLIQRFVERLNRFDLPIPNIVRHTDNASLMHSLASGRGFALLPASLKRTGPKGVRFAALPVELGVTIRYYALTRADDPSVDIESMLPSLRQLVGAQPDLPEATSRTRR